MTTDREKAEEALVKAGYVWGDTISSWIRSVIPVDYIAIDEVTGRYFWRRYGALSDLPSLLLPPTLTPEEKELLSLVSDALEVSADKQDDFTETKRLFNLSQGVDNLIARLGGG